VRGVFKEVYPEEGTRARPVKRGETGESPTFRDRMVGMKKFRSNNPIGGRIRETKTIKTTKKTKGGIMKIR